MSEASGQRVVVVTGASSGIGLETAKAFAALGWHVIGQGRDAGRSAAAEAEIRAASANGGTSSMRSPLQKRPGSYQLAGRRDGSRPIAWYVVATSSAQ